MTNIVSPWLIVISSKSEELYKVTAYHSQVWSASKPARLPYFLCNMQAFPHQHGYQPLQEQGGPPWEHDHEFNQQHQPFIRGDVKSASYQSSTYHPYQWKAATTDNVPLVALQPRSLERSIQEYKSTSRKCRCDCAVITLCALVWLLIAGSVASLIIVTRAKRNDAGWIDGQTVAGACGLLLGFSAIAATLNEALVDRVYRRIKAHALRGHVSGHHLRAANFQMMDCLKRLVTGKISRREFGVLISTMLLRLGPAGAFSCLQLTVQIGRNPNNPALFLTHIRTPWVPVPLALHIVSIFAALACSGLPPWSLFFNKWNEKVILAAYRPYLDIVPYGSAATSDQVAQLLDDTGLRPRDFSSLALDHKPGLQAGKKLKGTLTGTLIIIGIPSLLYVYQRYADKDGFAVARFTYSLGLSLFGIGYTLSQNFVIWTLGLEGITGTPRSDTNRLGSTSGLMLLVKALRQRRPVRVFFLYLLFWFHAVTVRLVLFVYIWLLSVHKTVPEQVSQDVDQLRWAMNMFWPVVLWLFILPPFAVWFFVPFKAPISSLDGWRIAKILEGAVLGKGRYGVDGPEGQGMARWSMTARSFRKERLL